MVAKERVAEERVEVEQVEVQVQGEVEVQVQGEVEVQVQGPHLAVLAQVAMKAETGKEILQSKPLPKTGTTKTTKEMVKPDRVDAKLASNRRWPP